MRLARIQRSRRRRWSVSCTISRYKGQGIYAWASLWKPREEPTEAPRQETRRLRAQGNQVDRLAWMRSSGRWGRRRRAARCKIGGAADPSQDRREREPTAWVSRIRPPWPTSGRWRQTSTANWVPCSARPRLEEERPRCLIAWALGSGCQCLVRRAPRRRRPRVRLTRHRRARNDGRPIISGRLDGECSTSGQAPSGIAPEQTSAFDDVGDVDLEIGRLNHCPALSG